MNEKDFQDVRLARPVAVTDLWELDDRIATLGQVTTRLENASKLLASLYREERVKSWELLLKGMMERK